VIAAIGAAVTMLLIIAALERAGARRYGRA